MRILRAILEGERDPIKLARLRGIRVSEVPRRRLPNPLRETGGRVCSTTSRKVGNRAANAFRMAAQAAGRSLTALGAFYRRMKSRMGPAKACTATARKLSRIFYRMLRYGKEYVDPGIEYYEQRYRHRAITNLKRRARLFGYELIKSQEPMPAVF
jgi:transposase